MVPSAINFRVQLAQAHGQELIYWTHATASMGSKVTNETQLAQAAINPNKGPWLYCANRLIPPDSGNIVPNST